MDKIRHDIKHAELCLRTGQPNMATLYMRRCMERLQGTRKDGGR